VWLDAIVGIAFLGALFVCVTNNTSLDAYLA